MEKLIAELRRLYLPDQQQPLSAALADHLRADTTLAIELATNPGTATATARALVLDFPRAAGEQHWLLLCAVANALQQDLKLPAPAVSVNGADRYQLWLSFAQPVPLLRLRRFHALLHLAYFADLEAAPAATVVALPPCRHQGSGLWAAFINPAMGASLAEDLGLEMAPPISAQAAFLHGLESMTPEQFEHAMQVLGAAAPAAPAAAQMLATAAPTQPSAASSLLLQQATLEDIIAELHRRNIEPTLRHVLNRQDQRTASDTLGLNCGARRCSVACSYE